VGYAVGTERLVSLMAGDRAGGALFLDVGHFTARSHVPVPARDAPATERLEPEKANQTHRCSRATPMQSSYLDDNLGKRDSANENVCNFSLFIQAGHERCVILTTPMDR
jgi:hypothetical protein